MPMLCYRSLKMINLDYCIFEVQAYRDPEMQVRLLEYNVLASRQYSHIPVYSYVICLLEVADVVDPPFTRRFLKWRGSTSLLLSSNQVMGYSSRDASALRLDRITAPGIINKKR